MTPFVFDSLSAAKQLREAGMAEGVAEAVVSVFQHASSMPDISHLATKADLDAQSVLMKADLDARSALMKADLDARSASMRADINAWSASMRADLNAQGALLKADLDAGSALMKADLEVVKADIGALKRDMVTKADLAELRAEFGARLLQQTWMMIGGVTALVTMLNVTLKIFD
ncbi:hypothetical protein MCEMIH16_00942 [Caulobacteraceae bacterium]